MTPLTQKIVRELLHYCPDSGHLAWKPRPVETSKVKRVCKAWNTRYSGKITGIIRNKHNKRVYGVLRLYRRRYYAHRVIWLYMTGEWPSRVDHIDGDGTNNTWINLREVSHRTNCMNKRKSRRNTSGVTGVCFNKPAKKWIARITVDYKLIYLGSCVEFNEAVKIRRDAEIEYGFHENHGGPRKS